MHHVFTVLGWLCALCAGVLILLAVVSWPPGGLMFALPFVFLILALGCAVLAALLLWLGRRLRGNSRSAPSSR